jgi:hypothetical protein
VAGGCDDRSVTTGTLVRRLDIWVVLRVGLVGVWLVWAALAWWTAPRPSTADQARADLYDGRVVAAQWASGWENTTMWGQPPVARFAQEGTLLVWRTSDLRVRYADVELGRGLTRQLLVAELPRGREAPVQWVGVLAGGLILVGLAVLLGGPAPAVGTRWYWFWMGGVPFGLGLLYWLAVERPWAHPAPPAVDPKTNKVRRRSGLTGFAFMILSGIALSILAALLGAVVGDFVVPTP